MGGLLKITPPLPCWHGKTMEKTEPVGPGLSEPVRQTSPTVTPGLGPEVFLRDSALAIAHPSSLRCLSLSPSLDPKPKFLLSVGYKQQLVPKADSTFRHHLVSLLFGSKVVRMASVWRPRALGADTIPAPPLCFVSSKILSRQLRPPQNPGP